MTTQCSRVQTGVVNSPTQSHSVCSLLIHARAEGPIYVCTRNDALKAADVCAVPCTVGRDVRCDVLSATMCHLTALSKSGKFYSETPEDIIASVPADRHEDLVFVQNGALVSRPCSSAA